MSTHLLHVALYLAVAVLGWSALVVAVALLIHGRAYVSARALEMGGRYRPRRRQRPASQPDAAPWG